MNSDAVFDLRAFSDQSVQKLNPSERDFIPLVMK